MQHIDAIARPVTQWCEEAPESDRIGRALEHTSIRYFDEDGVRELSQIVDRIFAEREECVVHGTHAAVPVEPVLRQPLWSALMVRFRLVFRLPRVSSIQYAKHLAKVEGGVDSGSLPRLPFVAYAFHEPERRDVDRAQRVVADTAVDQRAQIAGELSDESLSQETVLEIRAATHIDKLLKDDQRGAEHRLRSGERSRQKSNADRMTNAMIALAIKEAVLTIRSFQRLAMTQ